ncbi:MAG: proline--tRNA ligase [Oscillospiraceae bacterium]|jgi:prolyl-tRNA synthetase|nr:proline--tRNA ligase [Oscillospiraceae bacterium]
MKMSRLLGLRFKETPADCRIQSHIFMTRGGYIKNVGNGIFSLFTPARRVARKIENIIREEMDRAGGQEVLLPVAMPAALWKESGRFDGVKSELVRFKDRGGNDMVLGMTHEEAVVHLARNTARSYADYPFMVYQIQTKFRDEPRARGGLIRAREFTMKDAYSFHTSQEDLEEYYRRCHGAYERIFSRVGIPEVISVRSDPGMMGGEIAHEFMLLADVGEDTVVLCGECDFRSNMETAECVVENEGGAATAALERAETPGVKSIADVCSFFSITAAQTCKAVLYRKGESGEPVIVFIRGDLEVNETKVRNFLKEDVRPDTESAPGGGIAPGFVGPVGLRAKAAVLYDRSLLGGRGMVCGANETGYHYAGFAPERDLPGAPVFRDFAKTREGALCPVCGKRSITVRNGIEVGNIFQLGTKYTASMNMQYVDANGAPQYPVMGCYGIGVGRLAASVCEVRRDGYGPIWPMSIAPWQVHICAIHADAAEVSERASKLYADLLEAGVEVLLDDRAVSAGVMFSDADLLGVPVRVTVSPKTCARGVIEVSARDKSFSNDVASTDAVKYLKDLVRSMLIRLAV